MAAEILYSWGPGESRLALVKEGRLLDLAIIRPELLVGAIVLGRVCEVAHKLGAVFVDVGQDRPGFLQGVKGLTQGAALPVQIKADPQGGKGAALTAEITLAGRFLIYAPLRPGLVLSRKLSDDRRERLQSRLEDLVEEGEGVVARPNAAAASEEELATDLASLREAWAGIQAQAQTAKAPTVLWRPDVLTRLLADNPAVDRVLVDDAETCIAAREHLGEIVELHRDGPLFSLYDVDEAIEAALNPVVPLPCGGRVIIEHTAALTAIDVDSGSANPVEANTQAVAVIARQLRLRNIAGQMVVDFVSGGGKGALLKLVSSLKQAVSRDPVATHVIGITPLGLVEVTRERRGRSLGELMLTREVSLDADSLALSALRMALAEAAHRPGRALCLVVSSDVAAALARRSNAVAEAEARLGRKLTIRAEADRARQDIQVEEAP